MPFVGLPVINKVTDNCFLITNVSLAGGGSGTIGFNDRVPTAGANIDFPIWGTYSLEGEEVTLQQLVRVDVTKFQAPSSGTSDINVAKTGTTPQDFTITLTNLGAATSGLLEIYVYKAA